MPSVSVILTSYNHDKYLPEAIESVLAQTYQDFELIIWDDASSDNSWSVIKSYSDNRIKAFCNHETRRGIYNINRAIALVASGKYLAIHHSDDVWEPTKLERQVDFLNNNTAVGAVFTNALAIGENGLPLDDEKHPYFAIFNQTNRTRHQWLNYFFYRGNALCHPSILIRKECYQHCGPYRFGLAQLADFDMWIRLCLKYEIHVFPDKLVRFRVRQDEANTSGNRPDTRIRGTIEFYTILKRYLLINTSAEMLSIFPEAQRYVRPEGFESRFVLAMIALGDNTLPPTKLFGLDLLLELIRDPASAESLKALYGFDYRDLIVHTGKYDVFSLEQLSSLTAALAQRDAHLSHLNHTVLELDGAIASFKRAVAERDDRIASYVEALTDRDRQIAAYKQALAERDDRIASYMEALAERDGQIASYKVALTERNALADTLNRAVSDRDGQILALNHALVVCNAQIAHLSQSVAERTSELSSVRNELHSIYTSKKWKLVMKIAVPILLTKAAISKAKLFANKVFR